jgi:hypothetical protein
MLNPDDIRRNKRTAVGAVFQFVMETPKSPGSIYAFVEGDDDPFFYRNFILLFADKMHSFPCGGKGGVYEARERMANRVYRGKALFFVDKDLSDIIPEENYVRAVDIYTTDYYSIENELVSEDMLSKIWAELLHFRGERLDLVHQEKFQEELERFHELALPIMAWLVYTRRNERQPELSGFHFSKFFAWDDEYKLKYHEDVLQIGLIKLLEQVCKVNETPPSWSLNEESIKNELLCLEPKAYIHGKLELCFFVRFLHKLINLLNKDLRRADKIRMKSSLGEGNAVEKLSRYASIPQSLEKFLRENLKPST